MVWCFCRHSNLKAAFWVSNVPIGQCVLNNMRHCLKYSVFWLRTYGLSISWKTHIFKICDSSTSDADRNSIKLVFFPDALLWWIVPHPGAWRSWRDTDLLYITNYFVPSIVNKNYCGVSFVKTCMSPHVLHVGILDCDTEVPDVGNKLAW